ncbi:hypothetical protein HPP92_020583 [Vanilla planifolia]|uniref:RRM domain-containing protein n=1 Tax=Vanilla planifolia TaxID=51239 RepID=A0A835Q329_VANPL|nr:hypothetical protein HPP92_020583 [Vanilla planifolia]
MAVVNNADGSAESVSSSSSLDVGGGTVKELENHRATAPTSSSKDIFGVRTHRESSFSPFQMKLFQPAQKPAGRATASQLPDGGERGSGEEGFRGRVTGLEELLSKLNPMAEEFVPPSYADLGSRRFGSVGSTGAGFYPGSLGSSGFYPSTVYANGSLPNGSNSNDSRRWKNGHVHGKRRMNSRTNMAQREEIIRRTVYVSDIDQQVTEEELATLFLNCGQVVDCRVCGDPNSVLRFAFIEFTDEEGANAALSLSGTMLGFYPVKVLPSKTAIAPVDPKFLPRSEDEREMCTRTIYCTNIDSVVTQAEVKVFFETVCGPVRHLRLLGDHHHATRIAFVEFARAESAVAALNCSGAIMGSLPLRVSPSKTPVAFSEPEQSTYLKSNEEVRYFFYACLNAFRSLANERGIFRPFPTSSFYVRSPNPIAVNVEEFVCLLLLYLSLLVVSSHPLSSMRAERFCCVGAELEGREKGGKLFGSAILFGGYRNLVVQFAYGSYIQSGSDAVSSSFHKPSVFEVHVMDRHSWPWKKKTYGRAATLAESDDAKRAKYVQITIESYDFLSGLEDQVKILNEKLLSTQSEMTVKDDLVKQHAKVAEEAVSGIYFLFKRILLLVHNEQ